MAVAGNDASQKQVVMNVVSELDFDAVYLYCVAIIFFEQTVKNSEMKGLPHTVQFIE